MESNGKNDRARRQAVAQMTIGVPIVHFLMVFLGYKRVFQLLKRLVMLRQKREQTINNLGEFAQTMRLVNRKLQKLSPLPGSCLSRSLTLWFLMARAGFDPALHIGTRMPKTVSKRMHGWSCRVCRLMQVRG